MLPLVQRTTAAPAEWLAPASGLSILALQPDLDDIPALASEREALWSRLEKSTFLTDDEKRAAVGYGPKPPIATRRHHQVQPRPTPCPHRHSWRRPLDQTRGWRGWRQYAEHWRWHPQPTAHDSDGTRYPISTSLDPTPSLSVTSTKRCKRGGRSAKPTDQYTM